MERVSTAMRANLTIEHLGTQVVFADNADEHAGKSAPSSHRSGCAGNTSKVTLTFGASSIFDAVLASATDLPLEFPSWKYMQETLGGMHGSPSAASDGHPEGSPNWKRLRKVLNTDEAKNFCNLLAWVGIAVIFDTVDNDWVLRDLRKRLAESWFRIGLLVKQKVEGRDARDWIMEAIPVVCVQAIFRMLVDGFPTDQKKLAMSAFTMIDKLSNIAHFEVAGFQAVEQTWRKVRGKLFCSSVLLMPQLDQKESVNRQRLRERLENQPAAKPKPFSFGQTEPLSEDTLEHLLYLRNVQKEASSSAKKFGSGLKQEQRVKKSRFGDDLSIDRYTGISEVGEELLMKHLVELYPDDASRPGTPDGEESAVDDDTTEAPSTLRDVSTRDGRRMTRKIINPEISFWKERERREAAAYERKKRAERLEQRIDAPLPEEYRARRLDTSLVSPGTDLLAPSSKERLLLPQLKAAKQHLKMAPPMQNILPPSVTSMAKSRSESFLKKSTSKGFKDFTRSNFGAATKLDSKNGRQGAAAIATILMAKNRFKELLDDAKEKKSGGALSTSLSKVVSLPNLARNSSISSEAAKQGCLKHFKSKSILLNSHARASLSNSNLSNYVVREDLVQKIPVLRRGVFQSYDC